MLTFLYHMKDNLCKRRMVGEGDPFYLKFWANLTLLECHVGISVLLSTFVMYVDNNRQWGL